MTEIPYLDFYRRHDVSPVGQDISHLETHFQRRDSLYRLLGLPPAFVADRRVIEFGPGSGHNALFTATLSPARYVLVDGNPRGVAETRANLAQHFGDTPHISVIESTFEAFESDERFDLVLAEGFLPHTCDPPALLRRLAHFVAPGGMLVITTVSSVSILSENLRRLIRTSLISPSAPPAEQIATLLPILGPHLATLPGMSRSHEDWLMDNIAQPVSHAGLLTIPQAIETLREDFDVHGSSPAFITDFRWYKDIIGTERGFNERAISRYRRLVAALADHRYEPSEHDEETGAAIEAECDELWNGMNRFETSGACGRPDALVPIIERLAQRFRPLIPNVSTSLDEVAAYFAGRIPIADLRALPALWGRGQQYLGLIRRRPSSFAEAAGRRDGA